MRKVKFFTSFLLMLVLVFSLTTVSSRAESSTSSIYNVKEITLIRGSGGGFSATVPLKSIDPDNLLASKAVAGNVSMELKRFTGTNTYELFYTIICSGDYIKGFKGNFKVENTSVLSPSTYKNTNVNQSSIVATPLYTNMVPGTFTIPSSVDIVKVTASSLYITLLESGVLSASTLINTYQVN